MKRTYERTFPLAALKWRNGVRQSPPAAPSAHSATVLVLIMALAVFLLACLRACRGGAIAAPAGRLRHASGDIT